MKKNKDINEINELCQSCKSNCKQAKTIKLLTCPNFQRKEEQLEIKFPKQRRARK